MDALDSSETPEVTSPETVQPSESRVNVVDEKNQLVSLPISQAREALSDETSGYKPATSEFIQQYQNEQKYGGAGQGVLAGLEGAGDVATFGALPAIERGLGVPKEDIQGRSEAHPIARGLGQAAALVGTHLTGLGEIGDVGTLAGAMNTAGEGVAKALIPSAETVVQKIGSAAVKGAVENAIFQATDEVSKAVSGDPHETAEKALLNIGLASAIGAPISGAFGMISPLWEMGSESKLGQILKSVHNKMGGVETGAPDAIQEAITASGMNPAPEIQAAMSDSPAIRQIAETLQQSDSTSAGPAFQQSIKNFEKDSAGEIAGSLGKTLEELPSSSEFSKYEAGKSLGETLHSELSEKVGPLAEKFEALKEKYHDVELPKDQVIEDRSNPYQVRTVTKPGIASGIADEIGNLVQTEGWGTLADSQIMGAVNKTLKALPQLNKLSDLTKLITQVGDETYDFTKPQVSRAGMLLKKVLQEAEGDIVVQKLGEVGPELVQEHQLARQGWKEVSALKDNIDSRLKVSGGNSVGSFLKNLKTMSQDDGEKILQRLSGKNDADLLTQLSKNFPQTADKLRQIHVDQLLSSSVDKEGQLNARRVLKNLSKMSPELRDFSVPNAAQNKINAIGTMLQKLESKTYNFSNTARTIDKLWSSLPGSALGLATMVAGHNPALGFLVGGLTKWVGRDVPDAARLALLKFLGSNQPIDAAGFKTMVDFIHHASEGDSMINKTVKALFKAGQSVIPAASISTQKELDKLDSRLKELQTNPDEMMKVGGNIGHYLPDHSVALSQSAMTQVNYINSQRPVPGRASPLDKEVPVSKTKKAEFQNLLEIAQNPLKVLEKVQQGRLTPLDLQHLSNLSPQVYQKMKDQVYHEIIEQSHSEKTIPFQTRMNLSLFLGDTLDSSFSPQSIRAAQPMQQAQPGPQPMIHPRHAMTGLMKLSDQEMTPQQNRQAYRSRNR